MKANSLPEKSIANIFVSYRYQNDKYEGYGEHYLNIGDTNISGEKDIQTIKKVILETNKKNKYFRKNTVVIILNIITLPVNP